MFALKLRWLVPWMTAACLLPAAHAAAEPTTEPSTERKPDLPRTLRDGAPRSRMNMGTQARRPPPRAARPTPEPSIRLDPRERARAGDRQRGEALLQREIALLQRLVAHTAPGDPRRADALLRLSQAYQDLIWVQKVRLEQLRQQAARDCDCARAETAYAAR